MCEPPTLWLERLDQRFHNRAPRVVRDPGGKKDSLSQGKCTFIYKRIEAETAAQAAQWFDRMEKAINSLEAYPHRSPVTLEDRVLQHLLYGKKPYVYRIIYEIEEDTSRVYVLHLRPPGRDNMPKRLR